MGDDDQSIYGWRGATIENLKQAARRIGRTLKVIPLEQNYRSAPASILRAANNAVIAKPTPSCSRRSFGVRWATATRCAWSNADGEEHEAERAVALHPERCAARAAPSPTSAAAARRSSSDFAILYRANHQARVFEQKLRAAQIPYKVSGGQSFFDRAEIKDLCAWLRLLVNQDDDPAFLRAVTTPKRGIGHARRWRQAGRVLPASWKS